MTNKRDTTRALLARLWLTTIAFALACGRSDASAADGRGPAVRPPRAPAATSLAADATVPAGAMGDAVRRGHALLAATRDSLPSHVGNSLRCFSCHIDEGRRASGLPLVGAYARYPQYRARRARVEMIEERVNDCFSRSMNGRALPAGEGDMRDIVTYLAWMSRGVAVGDSAPAPDASSLARLEADTTRGAAVFAVSCARCHGASGQGTVVAPPVWGAKSFNVGAGMARYRTAAIFVLHNMPLDRPNTLTPQQALDVARYIDTRPRPDLAGKENDWPKGGRPSDVPYTTRAVPSADADTARARAHNGAR
jgi:thiosulfate dehydrogenase